MASLDGSSISNAELAEELEAIQAIYEPETVTLTNTAAPSSATTREPEAAIILRLPNHSELSFVIGFNADYPASPPRVLGTASTSQRGEGHRWAKELAKLIQRLWQPDVVCLYDVIVGMEETLEQADDDLQSEKKESHKPPSMAEMRGLGLTESDIDEEEAGNLEKLEEGMQSVSLRGKTARDKQAPVLDKPPDWIMSDVVVEKKSVFVARAAQVSSQDTAEAYLNHLLDTDKKVSQATHNITAWRIGQPDTQNPTYQDFDDDGETAAGGRLLHLLQLMDTWNVVIVVTRWYGGIKLGPDRFRIINAVAREALVRGGWMRTANDHNKGSKKKGKK